MKSYSFVTTWKVKAKTSDVWNVLMDAEAWPQWWTGMRNVKVLQKGDERGFGSITHYEVGAFFHALQFTLKTVAIEKHRLIEGLAAGDLIGSGKWEFSEANGVTVVIYHWNVKTTKKWMNRWAWLLKPVFRFSHNIVMRWGQRGLKRRLRARTI